MLNASTRTARVDIGGIVKLPRRQFLHQLAGAVALPALSHSASALDYPTKPIRLVVAVPPGGNFDIVGRLLAESVSERLGQQVIVENRAGANTNIGTGFVAHAPADGYTLLVCGSPSAINATLYGNLDFVFARDIAPVASISRGPLIMAVNPALRAKTVPEFISYTKANPGKVNVGTGGIGSTGDVAGALFSTMAGLKITRVPYRGEVPAVTDLIGGQVQVVFVNTASAINFVKAGTLRALGVSSSTRTDILPDVPAIAEVVPGYEASGWIGIGAPANTPAEIINRLNKEVNAALVDPKIVARLAELGVEPMSMTPAEFGKFIADEIEKWGKVIRMAGIKAE
jgi:tripartite-type tricarboxylate transporter receptor subunit TctC